jgi:MSHA biogenesis protein MshG
MPMFAYKGRNTRGDLLEGKIESPNAQAVAVWMTAVGITPVAISAQAGKAAQPEWISNLFKQTKLEEMELLLFTRQMGSLVRAGVPMMQALNGIQGDAEAALDRHAPSHSRRSRPRHRA